MLSARWIARDRSAAQAKLRRSDSGKFPASGIFRGKQSQQGGKRRDATDSLMRKKTSLSEFPKYFLIRTGCRAIVHQYQYE
jgi:hypothetical protein